jgi:hypothetical protein
VKWLNRRRSRQQTLAPVQLVNRYDTLSLLKIKILDKTEVAPVDRRENDLVDSLGAHLSAIRPSSSPLANPTPNNCRGDVAFENYLQQLYQKGGQDKSRHASHLTREIVDSNMGYDPECWACSNRKLRKQRFHVVVRFSIKRRLVEQMIAPRLDVAAHHCVAPILSFS